MAKKLHIDLLQRQFAGKKALSSQDLDFFYHQTDPAVSKATINWRVFELVKLGVLERISRGKFRIGKMKPFAPKADGYLLKIYKDLQTDFPYSNFCFWETTWLNEFSQHLMNTSMIIVETEKDACETIFNRLQESRKAVFLSPSLEIVERYASVQKNAIIVSPLVSESPVQLIQKMPAPTLEKILVDLICDTNVFYAYQGRELKHIWENAFANYTVKADKLLRYANRRKKKKEVMKYFPQYYKSALDII
jgi:hypothetical protein